MHKEYWFLSAVWCSYIQPHSKEDVDTITSTLWKKCGIKLFTAHWFGAIDNKPHKILLFKISKHKLHFTERKHALQRELWILLVSWSFSNHFFVLFCICPLVHQIKIPEKDKKLERGIEHCWLNKQIEKGTNIETERHGLEYFVLLPYGDLMKTVLLKVISSQRHYMNEYAFPMKSW